MKLSSGVWAKTNRKTKRAERLLEMELLCTYRFSFRLTCPFPPVMFSFLWPNIQLWSLMKKRQKLFTKERPSSAKNGLVQPRKIPSKLRHFFAFSTKKSYTKKKTFLYQETTFFYQEKTFFFQVKTFFYQGKTFFYQEKTFFFQVKTFFYQEKTFFFQIKAFLY